MSTLLLGVTAPILLLAAEPVARKFAEPTPAQSSPAPVSSLAQVAFSLALVLAAVFAAAWVLKRMRGFGNTRDDSAITVVAERAVGPRERVVLLQVGADRVLVGVANFVLTKMIPGWYGESYALTADALPGLHAPVTLPIKSVIGIWAVEGALLLGILLTVAAAFGRIRLTFADGTKAAVGGALLAAMNTASEYGFGGVIAALPGFLSVSEALRSVPNPLVNAAVSVTSLAGITGSASGGMSIALAAMSDQFIRAAEAAQQVVFG